MSHQIKGFFKRITGENGSYDARMGKQPILDAELKLKLFNDATIVSINGLETYLKSMNKLIDQQIGDKFNECKEIFSKYDKPNDQVMGNVFGRITEIQKEISCDVHELIKDIESRVLKPLVDYHKELSIVKEYKKELKDAYDKIEQCKQNLDKSKRDVENSNKNVNQSNRNTMMREFESKRFNELTRLEEKLQKSEKELDEATSIANEKYDKYTESLYKRIAEECDLTSNYLIYLKMQRKYHRQALKKLDTLIPGVEDSIKYYHKKPVFGYPIEEYVQRSIQQSNSNNQQQVLVSPVIKKLIDGMCRQNVFSEEGIFRIAGSRVKMNCLMYAINSGYLEYLDLTSDFDVHCLAGVLKQYIRELPDSLLCNHLYEDWIRAIKSPNKLEAFEVVLDKLPKVNYDNLCYLIKFLAKIVENSEQTKMTNSNMGICFGVSLLSSNNLMNSNNNNNTSNNISTSSNSLNSYQSDNNIANSTTTTTTNSSTTTNSTTFNNKTIDMATATNVFDFLLTNNERLFPIEMQFLIPNLISKPSINRSYNGSNNNNATLSKGSSMSSFQQIEPPTIVQRKTLTTPTSSQINNEANSSEVPRFIIETAANDLMNRNNNNNISTTPISQSSSHNLNSITNINRHIKKSSYDSSARQQIEDEKYSSNNSINSMSNKSFQSPFNQQDNSGSTSPKLKNKKQAPAPPPVRLNDSPPYSDNIITATNQQSSPPSTKTASTENIYPKIMPNFNTSISNSTKGANEIFLTNTTTTTASKILEKPSQPPPSLPNRPPPIGFNITIENNSSDLSTAISYPNPVASSSSSTTTTTNNNNSASLLSSSSLSTNSSSSSSSSQEMLNSPNTTSTNNNLIINNNNNKAPKPAVPRRPGGMISAHINRFNRGDIDLNDNIDESSTSATIKASSEITSL